MTNLCPEYSAFDVDGDDLLESIVLERIAMTQQVGRVWIIKNGKVLFINGNDFRHFVSVIEQTYDSLGITTRVVEVTKRENDIEFLLELALGTPLSKVVKYSKDLGMALSSITGDVEIEAPVKGRSLFAVRMPIHKSWEIDITGKYDPDEKASETKSEAETSETTEKRPEFPKTFRDYLAVVFYIIAELFEITTEYLRKIGNFIEGRQRIF